MSKSSEKPPHLSPPKQDALEITVLIAMPNAQRPVYRHPTAQDAPSTLPTLLPAKGKDAASVPTGEYEEEELPEVVFGVVEMPWKSGAEWKLPTTSEGDDSQRPSSSS